MNYPIYNFDYQFKLPEIVRYLKYFHQHIVYLNKPINFAQIGYIETNHQYVHDGLTIRLYWRPKTSELFANQYTRLGELMKRHKRGEMNIIGYDILRFSSNVTQYIEIPNQECIAIFNNKIMKNRLKAPYNEEEYKILRITQVEKLKYLISFLNF